MAVAADTGEPSLAGLLFVTHGAVGALSPAYTGVPVSLTFQDKCSRSSSRGQCGAPSSCVCWEVGLTTKLQVIESGFAQTSGAGDQDC
jgi:hypothetical protein